MSERADIVVIGGGAAGMMAALTARENGGEVVLLEPNQKLGRKLYITGKGRCNITNDSVPEVVLQNIPHNARFLYSAVNRFAPSDVKAYFEKLGVPLKTERGQRVFPQSDKAADVIDALFFSLQRKRIPVRHTRALSLRMKHGVLVGVETERGLIECKAVVLATGGVSYPLTGSTGDGHRMAEELGHTIEALTPSLIPLVEAGEWCSRMQGLSLRNVRLAVKNQKKKVIIEEKGQLLFNQFGMSGTLVLSASAHIRDMNKDKYVAILDCKTALTADKLEERLLRELGEQPNRNMHNLMETLLPRLMIPVMLEASGIAGNTKAHDLTKQQRRRLVEQLKQFRIPILDKRPIQEAIITAGGVKVKEIDPGTMMSKKVEGLFFAGELLDVDAYTGGFNLQIAWSTGRVAGQSAAEFVKGEG